MMCLSNSTLLAVGNQEKASLIQKQIDNCMQKLDRLFQENFQLKKDIAYEKKRYLDLMNAFIEMRNQNKELDKEKEQFTEKEQLIKEKFQLQQTLATLSEEVEFLSKRNETFLRELKTKDFYQTYKECLDELNKLREAHTVLIGMIQTQNIDIGIPVKQLTSSNRGGQLTVNRQSTPMNVRKPDNIQSNKLINMVTEPKENGSNRNRSSSIHSFITCGTMLGNNGGGIQRDQNEFRNDDVFEKAILQNEYLNILRDPQFLQKNDVNFLRR